jgi:hypothetical protein
MKMATFNAGKYFLGDPSYAIKQQCWSKVCDQMDNDGLVEASNGAQLVAFPTSSGDGTYYDQYDNAFGVDSGLLGLVALDFPGAVKKPRGEMLIVELEEDTEVWNEGGTMHFGKHTIFTPF